MGDTLKLPEHPKAREHRVFALFGWPIPTVYDRRMETCDDPPCLVDVTTPEMMRKQKWAIGSQVRNRLVRTWVLLLGCSGGRSDAVHRLDVGGRNIQAGGVPAVPLKI